MNQDNEDHTDDDERRRPATQRHYLNSNVENFVFVQ
jgi:hypothetical protein